MDKYKGPFTKSFFDERWRIMKGGMVFAKFYNEPDCDAVLRLLHRSPAEGAVAHEPVMWRSRLLVAEWPKDEWRYHQTTPPSHLFNDPKVEVQALYTHPQAVDEGMVERAIVAYINGMNANVPIDLKQHRAMRAALSAAITKEPSK